MIMEDTRDDESQEMKSVRNSQLWEEIRLSGINLNPIAQNQTSRDINVVEVKNTAINWLKESRQEVLAATPDFIANTIFTSTITLLLYLILRNNGLTTENLDKLINFSLIWLSSIIGGYIIRLLRLPPLLGMISAAAIVSNTSSNIEISEKLGETITSSGLAIILLLSGLELDINTLTKSSGIAVRLTCIPGIVEAFSSGLMAVILFGMPFWLALSMGFILAAVSPALIVVGMLKLQHLGYGVKKGIPSLVVAAASMDDIVAITGFSFFIGLAIQSGETNVLYSAIHGPLSIIIGAFVGIIGGTLLSFTKILNNAWKRTAIAVMLVLCQMFLLKSVSYAGAGALGSLIMGIVASHCWDKGVPSNLSIEANEQFTKSTEAHVSVLWSLIFEPLLFGFIGSSLNFQLLNDSFVKSFGVLIVGLLFRLAAAYFATSGGDPALTEKERLFISLIWLPKATVQAVLCSFPLLLIKDVFSPDHEDYERYILWGNQIMSTAILSIIITAPIGLAFMQFLGPKWLPHDPAPQSNDKQEEKETNEAENEHNPLIPHVLKLDELVRNISLSSNQVETSCILAELRQTLWKCKTILKIRSKKETA